MRQICVIATISATMACSAPPPAATPQQTPLVVIPADPAPSAATARADALIEDLRRREAEQAKRDKENPPPPAPKLDALLPVQTPRASTTPQPATIAALPPAPTTQAQAPAVSETRGEQWWKDQARALQVALEDETSRMNQAARAMQNSTLKITADEAEREYRARVAAVQNARAALDRFRDDARRAGVPPGWARWP